MAEPQDQGLAGAEYILEDYVEAHEQLQRHERTGSEVAVRRAAAALCRALVRLEDDEPFWRSMGEVRTSAAAAAAGRTVDDLDSLLGLERQVLEKAGVPAEVAASVVQDVARELDHFQLWPDEWSVERMRETVRVAGREACLRAAFRQPEQRSRLRKATGVGAGAVVIVANGIAAPPGVKEVSVFVGGRMILRFASSR
jgi:hypothetical protein